MSLFRNIFKEDGNKEIYKENEELKRKRKVDKEEFDNLKVEYDDITKKYMTLLEEKAQEFDKCTLYQEAYRETYTLTKEQKKEIVELKAENKSLKDNINELENVLARKSKEVDRLKKNKKKEEENGNN